MVFLMILISLFFDAGSIFNREQEYDKIELNTVVKKNSKFSQFIMKKNGLAQGYVIIGRSELIDVVKSGPYYNLIVKYNKKFYLLKSKKLIYSTTYEDLEIINNNLFKGPRIYNFRWW